MIEGEIKKEANRFILKSGREKYNLDRFPQITDEDIGEFVEFELTHNNKFIYSITFANGKIMKQQNPFQAPRNTPQQRNNNGYENAVEATAPYNFISLNDSIVSSELTLKKSNKKMTGLNEVSFDKWHTSFNEKEILNGYMDYEITNLTDLFIGNKPNRTETKDNKTKELERNFFTIGKNGEPAVSGSSFRGLVKNMICISSYSKLMQIGNKDKFFFYRRVAQRNEELDFKYNSIMGNFGKNVKSGYLSFDKSNNEYMIFQSNKRFVKIKTLVYEEKSKLNIINYEAANFTYKTIYTNQDCNNFSLTETSECKTEVSLIFSGYINKKNNQWIIYKNVNKEPIKLNKSIIEKNRNDSYRNIKIDILNEAEKGNKVPVFFIMNNEEVTAFGHTPFFRIPYEKSIKDHLPEVHKDTNKLDITEALFGMTTGKTGTEIFASRLHFMDAERIHTPEDAEYPKFEQPKILSSPKPTAYKLYLENGNDWNSNDKLRGYKLYHHKKADWIFKPTEKEKIPDSHPPKIKPLKPGNTFKGRIYFDNLTEVELGAILFVLKLKSDLCLKIGMGKPYGMGSIKVENIQLTTINRKERYKSIFSEDKTSFNLSEKQSDAKLIEELLKKYEAYILENIKSSKTYLWGERRMQELEKMLNIKNADLQEWDAKTRYMTLGDKEPYKADKARWRQKLPSILEI